jgi:hypothetical protein
MIYYIYTLVNTTTITIKIYNYQLYVWFIKKLEIRYIEINEPIDLALCVPSDWINKILNKKTKLPLTIRLWENQSSVEPSMKMLLNLFLHNERICENYYSW